MLSWGSFFIKTNSTMGFEPGIYVFPSEREAHYPKYGDRKLSKQVIGSSKNQK